MNSDIIDYISFFTMAALIIFGIAALILATFQEGLLLRQAHCDRLSNHICLKSGVIYNYYFKSGAILPEEVILVKSSSVIEKEVQP